MGRIQAQRPRRGRRGALQPPGRPPARGQLFTHHRPGLQGRCRLNGVGHPGAGRGTDPAGRASTPAAACAPCGWLATKRGHPGHAGLEHRAFSRTDIGDHSTIRQKPRSARRPDPAAEFEWQSSTTSATAGASTVDRWHPTWLARPRLGWPASAVAWRCTQPRATSRPAAREIQPESSQPIQGPVRLSPPVGRAQVVITGTGPLSPASYAIGDVEAQAHHQLKQLLRLEGGSRLGPPSPHDSAAWWGAACAERSHTLIRLRRAVTADRLAGGTSLVPLR